MELLMLSHVPTRILEEGFLPAAVDLKLKVTILTDCVREHVLRARASSVYRHCKLLECDIFNPLSVARLIAVHDLKFSGVLAACAGVQACAALIADYLGLPGPSWRSALLCDQRSVVRSRFEAEPVPRSRWIVNCAEPDVSIDAASFPLTVQALETDLAGDGQIVRDPQELKQCLAQMRDGYALVEKHLEGERYALDGLGTPEGFVVLCGSHIRFTEDKRRTRRIQTFMQRPPCCDEVLALLSGLDLGLGRHHVEYVVTGQGIGIREIHNGLHDDDAEFALNVQLDGDVFRETIKVCLGLPTAPLPRIRMDATRAHSAMEAAM